MISHKLTTFLNSTSLQSFTAVPTCYNMQ